MTAPLSVRPVRTGDAEALAEIHAAAWRAAYGGVVPAETLERRYGRGQRLLLWRGLLAGEGRAPWVEVAVEPDAAGTERLLGFVWTRMTGRADADFAAEIVALNVAPEQWRRGIGRRLMAAAAARLDEAGADGAYLWVLDDNPGARAFYDALGGRIVDRGSESLGELVVPTLAYAWKPLTALLDAARP